jgi:hypothetical protein
MLLVKQYETILSQCGIIAGLLPHCLPTCSTALQALHRGNIANFIAQHHANIIAAGAMPTYFIAEFCLCQLAAASCPLHCGIMPTYSIVA